MSSLSSLKTVPKSSSNFHSSSPSPSSSIWKTRFIWRFPPFKFNNLPSCTSKGLLTVDMKPLNIDNELIQRQELAIFIYELGLHVNVSFTCIYMGVVYMHRFFMLHSLQLCIKESVAAACLFLACKVNEMPRPLNEFTQHLCQLVSKKNNNIDNVLSTSSPANNITTETLLNYSQEIIDYENILLASLGFCLNVDQPYLTITRISQTLSMPKEMAHKAYEIATKCVFFTLFPMKYTTNLIACFALNMAITSSQINISDNPDGSQWFHLLNEEFTEKLLKELADEYQLICTGKCSKKSEERFEQIQQQMKFNYQQSKSRRKTNYEQSKTRTYLHDNEQNHYSLTTTKTYGLVQNRISTSSLIQHQAKTNDCDYSITRKNLSIKLNSSTGTLPAFIQADHHTPSQSSSTNYLHSDCSPSIRSTINAPNTTFQSSLSPKQTKNNSGEKNQARNGSMPISSAKPIPTLMTSFHSNSCDNYAVSDYNSYFSNTTFKYLSASPSQHHFHSTVPSIHNSRYSSTYLNNNSYHPQHQAPIFYQQQQDTLNAHIKRYSEPPAPPTKRFRYNINTYQHY